MSSFFATPPAGSTGTTFGAFGQQNQQQQQQPQQPSGFAGFGAQQPAQQPAAGAFAGFGQQNQQQQQQQQQPASGFAGFGQSTAQQPSTSNGFGGFGQSTIFGNNGQQQQQQQQPAGTNSFAGFGQPQQQQQQQQQQAANAPVLTRTTKFNDLPDNIKSVLEGLEAHIQGNIAISTELGTRSSKQKSEDATQPIRAVNREAVAISNMLEGDVAATRFLKERVDQANQDLVLATRILDGYKNHAQHGQNLKNHASFPLEFFQREAVDLKEKLQWCKSVMEQIERKLASSQKPVQQQAALAATMQAQHNTFMALAASVAQVHAEVERVKAAYTALFRAKHGAAYDPFQDTH